jgi:hypothetical protein
MTANNGSDAADKSTAAIVPASSNPVYAPAPVLRPDGVEVQSPEARAARNRRSAAIAIGLALFMATIFAVTMAHLGGDVLKRDF